MKNKKVRAPKGGYDFEAKNEYRHKVWSCFAKHLNVKKAVVLFLPSKEGLEIPIALKYGFKEENLIAIDDCPAVIAVSKWRKKYPKIKFYGNSLARAGERITADKIKIDAANLDLCGNISTPMIKQLKGFFSSGCLKGYTIISLTMLSGRETQAVNTIANLYIEKNRGYYTGFGDFDKRIQVMCSIIEGVLFGETRIRYNCQGNYKSGKMKMVYGVFEIMSVEFAVQSFSKKQGYFINKVIHHNKIQLEYFLFKQFIKDKKEKNLLLKTNLKIFWEIDDIYDLYLKEKRDEIETHIKKLLRFPLFFTIRGIVLEYLRRKNERTKKDWYFLFDDDYFIGTKMIFRGYQNIDKATQYLNEISWDIRR